MHWSETSLVAWQNRLAPKTIVTDWKLCANVWLCSQNTIGWFSSRRRASHPLPNVPRQKSRFEFAVLSIATSNIFVRVVVVDCLIGTMTHSKNFLRLSRAPRNPNPNAKKHSQWMESLLLLTKFAKQLSNLCLGFLQTALRPHILFHLLEKSNTFGGEDLTHFSYDFPSLAPTWPVIFLLVNFNKVSELDLRTNEKWARYLDTYISGVSRFLHFLGYFVQICLGQAEYHFRWGWSALHWHC